MSSLCLKKRKMNKNRDFKGVWIPKEIWLSTDLSPIEKFFLIEIDSLDNENGCYASNAHFAELFGLSIKWCSGIIRKIEKKGYIKITLMYEGKQVKKRTIKMLNKTGGTLKNGGGGYPEKQEGGILKNRRGYPEKQEGNNTKEQYNKRSLCQRKKISDDDMKLAQFIFSKIQQLNPKERPPNFDKWANSIRLIVERDKRTHKEIQDVFLWANNDPFWSVNIRSPDKLRKQFTVLEDTKRQGAGNEKNKRHCQSGSYEELEEANDYALEYLRKLEQEESDEEFRGGFCEVVDIVGKPLPAPGVYQEDGKS